MDATLKAAVEKKFNKKQTACLLQVLEQVGVHSWRDLQNLPILIGRPTVCGLSVYELTEKLNQEREKQVEVTPVQAEDVTVDQAEQDKQPDPKPKRRSRNGDAKEIEDNGQ